MAHIVVYLQRTPQGLHPASALSLCWARDIGSQRGASVTALAIGDAGPWDAGIVRAAGRYGADAVEFCGPGGLSRVYERLHPVHILVPLTLEGRSVAQDLPGGPVIPRWLQGPNPRFGGADALTGVLAGALPWHDFEATLESEYESTAVEAPTPAFAREGEAPCRVSLELQDARGYVIAPATEPDHATLKILHGLGLPPVEVDEVATARAGLFFWLARPHTTLPARLAERSPSVRVATLAGPTDRRDDSWSLSDWVFAGPCHEVLTTLAGPSPWTNTPG